MTQQFKFGDRVKFIPMPESIGVVLSEVDEYGYVNVMFDDALEVEDFPVSGLELIPHPDTVRLDWLAKNDCALTERLCDEDGDLLDTSFAVIQKQEEHFEVLTAACDIREAIDAAMRQEAV